LKDKIAIYPNDPSKNKTYIQKYLYGAYLYEKISGDSGSFAFICKKKNVKVIIEE
jgi:hypothetical protein